MELPDQAASSATITSKSCCLSTSGFQMTQYLGRSQSPRFLGVSWFPVDSSHLCSAPGVAQRVVPGCDHCCTAHLLLPPSMKASACRALPSHKLRLSSFWHTCKCLGVYQGATLHIDNKAHDNANGRKRDRRDVKAEHPPADKGGYGQIPGSWEMNLSPPELRLPSRQPSCPERAKAASPCRGARRTEKTVSEDFLPVSRQGSFPLKSMHHPIFPQPQCPGTGPCTPLLAAPCPPEPPAPHWGWSSAPHLPLHTHPCARPGCAGHPRAGTRTQRAPPPCQG